MSAWDGASRRADRTHIAVRKEPSLQSEGCRAARSSAITTLLGPASQPPANAIMQQTASSCHNATVGRALGQRQRSARRHQAPRSAAAATSAAAAPRTPAAASAAAPQDAVNQPRHWAHTAGSWAAGLGAACLLLAGSGSPALAAARLPPIDDTAPGRCDVSALDKFADTRATFSLEASGGNMTEAIVDIRGCDFRLERGRAEHDLRPAPPVAACRHLHLASSSGWQHALQSRSHMIQPSALQQQGLARQGAERRVHAGA